MRFLNVFKYTWQMLAARKSRSFLTMLGIIIGVAAVISIMAVGAGAQDFVVRQVEAMGSNIIGILPGAAEEGGPPAALLGVEVTTLTHEDALALAKLPHYTAVCSYAAGQAVLNYGKENKDTSYLGVSPDYINVENTSVTEGRFFRQSEVDSIDRVVVLGSQVKEELFGKDDPLDKRIKINQVSFKVIGVMKERGIAGLQNSDEQVFVPIKTAQKVLLGIDHVTFIRGKVDDEKNTNLTIAQTESMLRYRHNIKDPAKDDFTVRSTAQALDILGAVTQALSLFLAAVAAISLIVGGIGIMNIMFVSVNERTQEVGLRKSLGAKRKDILLQFLMESMALTIFGGLLGIVLGILISWGVSFGIGQFGYIWNLIVTPLSIIISVTMAAAVGLFFGLWPANRASKLDPIRALRYE